MLPTFILAGVQRAGTTWIYESLREHPQIFLPYAKELHYFDLHYDRGPKWYEAWFEGHTDEIAVGDLTPNYFHDPSIAGRIHDLIPKCRIVIVLRQPVDFLRSLYALRRRAGFDREPFEVLSSRDEYRALGLFGEKLDAYRARFEPDRLFVGIYEDLRDDPRAFLRGLLGFLGVDAEYAPPAPEARVNARWEPRFGGLHRPLAALARAVRGHQLPRSNAALRRVRPLFDRAFYRRESRPDTPLDPALRANLERYYASDVTRLSERLDRDLHERWGIPRVAESASG